MPNSTRDILIVGLRDAYALEGQALSTMRTVHDRLENYPQLKAALAEHIAETERQQSLVEQCLGQLGEQPSALKEMATRLMANVQGMAHMLAGDEILKNLFALYAFEHFEQASYRSLIAMAGDVGETRIVETCRQILAQEEAAGKKIGSMIEDITRTYVRLESAGASAKV
jgi:ferritin-like metal-binding protein YciE